MKPHRRSRFPILTTLVIALAILIATGGVTPAAGVSGDATEEANGRLQVTPNLSLALSETATAIPTETPTATPTLTPTDTPTATDTPTPTDTPTATPTDTPSSITFNPPSLSFDTGSSGTVEVTVNDPDAAVVTSLTVRTAEGLTVTETSRLNVTNTLIQAYTVASSAPGPYTLTFTATFDAPAKSATTDLAVSVNAIVAGEIIKPTLGIVVGTKRGAPIAGYTVINLAGTTLNSLLQITDSTAEVFVMVADFNGNGIDSVLASTGARDQGLTHGPGSAVAVSPLNRGVDVPSMVPFPFQHPSHFDNNPTGEVRIAAGNLIGDAPDELIVIQGANAQSRLRICGVRPDGTFANIDANSFRPSQLGNPDQGIKVITTDIDNDGYDEIVAALASKTDFGAGLTGNYMQAMNVAKPSIQSMTQPIPGAEIVWAEKQQIFGDNSNPSGGLNMAAGDLNGDGEVEVVVVTAAPNPSDPADRGNSKLTILVPDFTDGDFANGSFSTMKDNNGAGENVCLRLFSEATNPSGDVSISVADLDGDGKDEIVVSRGISIDETVAKSDVTVFYFDEAGIGDGVLNRLPKLELPQVYSTEENPGGGANVAASENLLIIDESITAHLFTIPLPELPSGAKPLEMVFIPSGTFLMGSPIDERWRVTDEVQHEVTHTQAFYFGVHEVTQAQWETVMESNPSRISRGLNYPVSNVNWDDCQAFIERLNGMGLGTFRLPTEAEWEYACRAGTDTAYSFGNAFQCSVPYAYCDLMDEYMWWTGNKTYGGHARGAKQVGMKLPNRWGLYDMHGNLWEWCSDYWNGAYSSSPIVDPKGHPTGIYRVLRGGGWSSNGRYCRSAHRGGASPDLPDTSSSAVNFGFRLLREYP